MTSTPRPACPSCGAEVADWLLCQKCTTRLRTDLTALPGLILELETTVTRQSRMSEGGRGGKGKARPLPFNIGASKLAGEIKASMVGWVRDLELGDTDGLVDTTHAIALWLSVRLERIKGHANCAVIAQGVADQCQKIMRTIERPKDRIILGPCGERIDGEVCGNVMYAGAWDSRHRCSGCGAEYVVADRRAEMLSLMEHQWATAGVCSTVLGEFGVEVKAATVQNWVSRGQLVRRGVDGAGHSLFRIGDVIGLAEDAARKAQEARLRRKEKAA